MSQELATTETTGSEEIGPPEDIISRFRKAFPRFFTPNVVANREAGSVPVSPSPPKRGWIPVKWQPVARKPGTGRSTHVALHLNKENQSFFFRCPCKDVSLPVSRDVLMTALAIGQGHEWVRIETGTEVFYLNRMELRAAIQTLEG